MTQAIFINFKFYTDMKKEELFNDSFLKQFKTGEELTGFLKQLQKRGIEKDVRRRIGWPSRLFKTRTDHYQQCS